MDGWWHGDGSDKKVEQNVTCQDSSFMLTPRDHLDAIKPFKGCCKEVKNDAFKG
jgi:hypothetical protein